MDSSPRSTASSDLYSPSESAQPEAAPITNGIEHEVSHKRKREQDPNPNRIMQNRRDFPTVVDSHGSTDEAPSRQADNLMENLSRVKRPRPNGYSIGTGADLSCKSSALPAVHWQHIFCYVPPVFLGRMLSVNHAFNTILTPGQSEEDPTPLPNSIIQPLKAEAIWALSRRRFCPGVPRPIHGLMELEMWKLLKGNGCQICEKVKVDTFVANPQDPWESGPGDTGVRVIWPFGLRCCGPCLQDNTQKVPDCQHHWLATIRNRELTSHRNWIFLCRRIARFSSCRVSPLPSYQKIITTLVITSCEALQLHLCCA